MLAIAHGLPESRTKMYVGLTAFTFFSCGCYLVAEKEWKREWEKDISLIVKERLEEIDAAEIEFTIEILYSENRVLCDDRRKVPRSPIKMRTNIETKEIILISTPLFSLGDILKGAPLIFRVIVGSNFFPKQYNAYPFSEREVTLETAVKIIKLLEAKEVEKVAIEYFYGICKRQKGESNQERTVLKTRAEILLARMKNDDEAGASPKEVQQ